MTEEWKQEIEEMVKDDSDWLKSITTFAIQVCENELPVVKESIDESFYEELKDEDERFEDISDTLLKKLVSLTTQRFCDRLEEELFLEPYGVIPSLSESEYVDRENEKYRKEHPDEK